VPKQRENNFKAYLLYYSNIATVRKYLKE